MLQTAMTVQDKFQAFLEGGGEGNGEEEGKLVRITIVKFFSVVLFHRRPRGPTDYLHSAVKRPRDIKP